MKKMSYILMFAVVLGASGCASMDQSRAMNANYNPKDYVPANAVTASQSHSNIEISKMPKYKSNTISGTAFGFSSSPEIMAAYKKFMKTGQADNIRGDAFVTLAYNAYSRPVIQCSVGQVCQIELEKNETINAIALGDTKRWMSDKIYTGKPHDGSWIVLIKPTVLNIATNLTITTDQRTYNFGIVSQVGESPIVNFWYPHEMANKMISNQAIEKAQSDQEDQNTLSSNNLNGTYMDVNNLNFNYGLSGDKALWSPSQVFDDGSKTFIRMPPMVDRTNFPVLYIYRNNKKQMINYRYKRPYIILDGLFLKAALISGSGDHKTEVDIINKNFKSA